MAGATFAPTQPRWRAVPQLARTGEGEKAPCMCIRLRDLSQGALLHVVCALLAGPMKAGQIARRTGKSLATVRRALAVLDEKFHLVTAVPDGRWPIWRLRDTRQVEPSLPDPAPTADRDCPGDRPDLATNSEGEDPAP